MPTEKFERYKTEVEEIIGRRERLALRKKGKSEKHLEIYGGVSLGIGTKTYLHGPMDFAKTLKPRFRVGGLDLPERSKRCTSSQEEEEVDAQTDARVAKQYI